MAGGRTGGAGRRRGNRVGPAGRRRGRGRDVHIPEQRQAPGGDVVDLVGRATRRRSSWIQEPLDPSACGRRACCAQPPGRLRERHGERAGRQGPVAGLNGSSICADLDAVLTSNPQCAPAGRCPGPSRVFARHPLSPCGPRRGGTRGSRGASVRSPRRGLGGRDRRGEMLADAVEVRQRLPSRRV